MSKSYHFITGLPRSGSTLLGGILLQNPRFHAGMSSPAGGLVNALMRATSEGEFSVTMTEDKTQRLIRGIFDAYYDDVGDAEIVFDTNRQWSAQLPLVSKFAPEAKVIACVRNPAWVMDSVEKIVRANPLRKSKLFRNDAERATVFTRTDVLTRPDRMIGYAWSALKDAYYSDEAGRLLLVEYDILCQRPEEVMRLIYDFIGEPYYDHDFDNVEYEAETFDTFLNTPGLHTVGKKVEFKPRRSVLPPDVFERLAQMVFWNDLHQTKAHKIVQQPPEEAKPAQDA